MTPLLSLRLNPLPSPIQPCLIASQKRFIGFPNRSPAPLPFSEEREMSYQIDPQEPSEAFLQARHVAGCRLQEQFTKHGGNLPPQRDFKWVKTEMTWPSFEHLTFAYGNQVFSVLVELVDGPGSLSQPNEVQRCLDASSEHRLVPCIFPVDARTLRPRSVGWNLLHLVDRQPVEPAAWTSETRVEMSEWEIRNFCIQVVRGHIEDKMGATIQSFCDVIGIDPQIWFEDASGALNWVIVRHYPIIKGDETNEWIPFVQTNPRLTEYDGFLAAVSLASAEPFIYDSAGEIVPLSERFSGKAPLYRGDGFYIKFDGLQRIHVS